MSDLELDDLLNKQKEYFNSKITLNPKYRILALKRLYKAINDNIELIYKALNKDLGKSRVEAYMCEIGLVLNEISYMIRNVKKFSKPKKVKTPLAQFHSKSYKLAYPYGNVLIMSPWNYPFLLSLDPLVEAIASGNTVVLKMSRYSENTSAAIKYILDKTFDECYIKAVCGGSLVNQKLMNMKFDYIFFTGSKNVGKLVYESASKNQIPVTLELGGKSPCIVDERVNLKLAARRIVFGKYLNCGQTCVAPDYIFIHKNIKNKFIELVKKEIIKQFGNNPLDNELYGKIINEKHFNRLIGLIDEDKVIYGGKYNENTLKIEPSIIDNVSFNDAIMKEEIFGPLMPLIEYDDINAVKKYISLNEAPLALYIFSKNKKLTNDIISTLGFGGGCVNDVIIHLATPYMSFGGYKESGIGGYHGKTGFDTFSHYKSIVDKKTWIDLPMRYQPYKGDKLIKMFLK